MLTTSSQASCCPWLRLPHCCCRRCRNVRASPPPPPGPGPALEGAGIAAFGGADSALHPEATRLCSAPVRQESVVQVREKTHIYIRPHDADGRLLKRMFSSDHFFEVCSVSVESTYHFKSLDAIAEFHPPTL